MSDRSEVTKLLIRLGNGEDGVYDELYPLVYQQLRELAYMHMNRQSPEHTFSKTDLVHETYLKMINQSKIEASNRNHFFAIASRCMRQVLIDYARKKNAQKRGGNNNDITYIDKLFVGQKQKIQELIDIDDALTRLERLNERLGKVVEMRFFGEMTVKETAESLNISVSTVKRDWMKARGWLYKELKGSFIE